ncbi:MAG: transglutaminase-like cysteine peptidase [Kiloniellales bacterium]|nr:transglutaminase-like cysteine peptidase [Kiloniellales bacterium]
MHRRRFLIATTGAAAAVATGILPSALTPELIHTKDAFAVSLENILKQSKDRGKAIFGSTEVGSRSFKAIPKWARILKQMQVEGPALRRCTENSANCNQDAMKAWNRIILEAGPLSRPKKILNVNRYFNRWPYKLDREIYGTSEYWASPMEFMRRSGDCEDFAIAKFFALRHLGFKNEEMRIVILWDQIRAVGHAVLAVYIKDDILVLDSLSDVVLSHVKYKQYVPQYSMNETTRWAHVKV